MADETKTADVSTEAPVKEEVAPVATPAESSATPAVEEKAEEVEVPTKFKKIVEEIEKMTVLDLSELVKVFEKKFGVSAAAVAVAGSASGSEDEEDQKSTADVELTNVGDQKIAVIKAVKAALSLGLKEAKDLIDGAPSMLKQGLKKEEAEELKKTLEAAGATVTLK